MEISLVVAPRQSQTMIQIQTDHLNIVFIEDFSGFNGIKTFGQLKNKKPARNINVKKRVFYLKNENPKWKIFLYGK